MLNNLYEIPTIQFKSAEQCFANNNVNKSKKKINYIARFGRELD